MDRNKIGIPNENTDQHIREVIMIEGRPNETVASLKRRALQQTRTIDAAMASPDQETASPDNETHVHIHIEREPMPQPASEVYGEKYIPDRGFLPGNQKDGVIEGIRKLSEGITHVSESVERNRSNVTSRDGENTTQVAVLDPLEKGARYLLRDLETGEVEVVRVEETDDFSHNNSSSNRGSGEWNTGDRTYIHTLNTTGDRMLRHINNVNKRFWANASKGGTKRRTRDAATMGQTVYRHYVGSGQRLELQEQANGWVNVLLISPTSPTASGSVPRGAYGEGDSVTSKGLSIPSGNATTGDRAEYNTSTLRGEPRILSAMNQANKNFYRKGRN